MKKKGEEKEKKKYVPVEGLLGPAEDYHIYHPTLTDRVIAGVIGAAIGLIVIYVFFTSVIGAVAAAVVCAIVAQPIYYKYKKKKRLNALLLQFKDMLEALSASYSVGKNTIDAFMDAKSDMTQITGDRSDIVKELQIIIEGCSNGLRVEDLMMNWAQRSGLEDVESFAQVFAIANRQGSDMKRVVNESKEIISQKIEIEMELETMLASNKNELNVMICMPVLITGMISVFGLGSIAENTPFNMAVKIGCLAVFVGAYFLGVKITKIKV